MSNLLKLWLAAGFYIADSFNETVPIVCKLFSRDYLNRRVMSIKITREDYLRYVNSK